LKFVLLFYKLKSPGLTWTSLVQHARNFHSMAFNTFYNTVSRAD